MSEVTLEGLQELERDWNNACGLLSDACARAVDKGTKAGVAAVRKAPKGYTSRTGALQRSGQARVLVVTRGGATGIMRWSKTYASAIDEGAKAHDIYPKLGGEGPVRGSGKRATQQRRRKDGFNADVGTTRIKLRWTGSDGNYVFAFMVKHPGNPAYHFSEGAIQPCVDAVFDELRKGIDAAQKVMKK